MGIITLGIGPPEPNVTYLITGGLDMGAALVAVPTYTATAAIRLTATTEAELEP